MVESKLGGSRYAESSTDSEQRKCGLLSKGQEFLEGLARCSGIHQQVPFAGLRTVPSLLSIPLGRPCRERPTAYSTTHGLRYEPGKPQHVSREQSIGIVTPNRLPSMVGSYSSTKCDWINWVGIFTRPGYRNIHEERPIPGHMSYLAVDS